MESKTKHLRVVDEDRLQNIKDDILDLLTSDDITLYEALGILELVKDGLLYGVVEDEDE